MLQVTSFALILPAPFGTGHISFTLSLPGLFVTGHFIRYQIGMLRVTSFALIIMILSTGYYHRLWLFTLMLPDLYVIGNTSFTLIIMISSACYKTQVIQLDITSFQRLWLFTLMLPDIYVIGNTSFTLTIMISSIPAGSPSRGGDVTVYVLDINQPSLPTLFILFLCLFLSPWSFQLYFLP